MICLIFVEYQAANDCDLEPIAYDFFTQAFVLYEEDIAVLSQPSMLIFSYNYKGI